MDSWGDFNMIEYQEDKCVDNRFEWKGNEKKLWARIKDKLKLFDSLEGNKEHKVML